MNALLVAAYLAAAPPQSSQRAAVPPRLPTAQEIDAGAAALLQRAGAGEPTLQEVQQAAARHALSARASLPKARRARMAALLPKVTIELQRDERQYRVVGLTSSSEVDYVRQTPGSQLALRLSWDLAGVGFTEAELRLAEKEEAAHKARAEAVERATRLWFERRRLLLALAASPAASATERAEREVEIEELGGALDAITGGAWSAGGAR